MIWFGSVKNLSHIYLGDEQYNKLVTEFAENQWLASSICFIGDTYLRAGEIDLASLLYNKVAATWPDDPQTIFAKAGLAKVAAQLGNDSEVSQIIDGIIADYADNPDIADAIYGIGEHYWNMALSEYQEAYAATKGRGRLMSKNPGRNYYLKAQTVWEKSIRELPVSSNISMTYRMVAEACRSSGQFEKALQYYQAFIENWPDDEAAGHCQFMTCSLYQSLGAQGNISESEACKLLKGGYNDLVLNYPENPQVRTVQAWISNYEMKSKPDEVPQSLEEAVMLIEQYKQRRSKGAENE